MSERLHPVALQAADKLEQGRISRRDFLRYATLLGVSVGAAGHRLRLTPAQTLRASGWKAMRPAPSTRLTAVVSILAVYGATSCPMAASAVRP
ncbi:MAG TPA: twin-arginine translocation signal domain-containing protein, partial [Caldilinea sp.]|nr:twin-arginine translocation signal domain-containing protein [Caldilinea sp.]